MKIYLKVLFAAALIVGEMGLACAQDAHPPVQSGAVDFATLDSIVGDANTVVFGEDSHEMLAIHRAVPRIFEHLVTQKGFRVFVFEAQWALPQGLADFMHSDRTKLNARDSYWLDGAFASQPIANMLVWIRNWNRSHPHDPILIEGFQPENPVSDFRGLFAFLDKALPAEDTKQLEAGVAVCRAGDAAKYKTDLEFLIANSKRTKAGLPTYSDAGRAACLDGISAIKRYLRRHQQQLAARFQPRELAMARLRLLSLATYVGVIRRWMDDLLLDPKAPDDIQSAEQSLGYGKVDHARFIIYETERAFDFPKKKVFLWMHNWHAFRHASETGPIPGKVGIPRTTISVGERIAAKGGKSVVTIGTLVPCDQTCVEPAHSLEPAFARYFGGKPGWVNLHDPGPAAKLPLDKLGTIYANLNKLGMSGVVLDRQFDGIFYIPKSKATH